jgi:hypothetical protein
MFQFSITRRQPWNYRKEANNENKVEIITVTQNCVMMFETKPELSAIGKNTTTITKVMKLPFHQFRSSSIVGCTDPVFTHLHVSVNIF